jgi:pilus assembly protein FimV
MLMRKKTILYAFNLVWLWILSMPLLAASQTGVVANSRQNVVNPAGGENPIVRNVNQKNRNFGTTASGKTLHDVGKNSKTITSGRLQLTLSMSLSNAGTASIQIGDQKVASNVVQSEQVEKERRLKELFAQIAETEKIINARQSRIDRLKISSNSDAVVSSMIETNAESRNGHNTDSNESMTQPAKQKVTREGMLVQWLGDRIKQVIGIAAMLFAAFAIVWFRKSKAERNIVHVTDDKYIGTESITIDAGKNSALLPGQSKATPALGEQGMQSILPPEYEMLEEADIYLRFGHDKLAEEALREAIKINPRNPQAYLTLARIYNSREDKAAFLELAEQFRSIGDEIVWDKIVEMGRSLDPDNPLYS